MNLMFVAAIRSSIIKFQVRFRSMKTILEARATLRGLDYIKDPRLNKGLAFSMLERQALGLHGLLAPKFISQEDQLEIATISINRYRSNLNKYLYLAELQDTNERLFFSLISSDIEKYMPIIYTPTVGLACQRFGVVYTRPRGLYITIHDKGNIAEIISNWPEHRVKAICVTDGERILGLGDLGAYGMGIPVGKLALYTALAGIKPHQCLPICLDTGTDNARLIKDPLYIGLRQKRTRGRLYDDFIDEFMQACVARYGNQTLVQFEDFALINSIRLLKKYKTLYCTFNDDIQGTAAVSVAGILASSKITNMKITEHTFLFLGAGSAATGIASLLLNLLVQEGMSRELGIQRIYLFDLDGLVTTKRKKGVPAHALKFSRNLDVETNFEAAVVKYKPTCLIGCSTAAGAFTPKILQIMGKLNKRPLIFALSNPTSKAECTAQQAYDHTEGRCVFASGSPFPPVVYKGKTFHPGQGNNAFIFPGVALGVIAVGCYHIPNYMFLIAAKAVASCVTHQDLERGNVYPSLSEIRTVSLKIAAQIGKIAFEKNLASAHPIPDDMEEFIKGTLYSTEYVSIIPNLYNFPTQPQIQLDPFSEARKHYQPLRGPGRTPTKPVGT